MRLIKVAAVGIALVFLGGCAAVHYTYDGKKYNSRQQFIAAVEASNGAAVAAITPLPAPVTKKKLLFAFPSRTVIAAATARYMAQTNGATPTALQAEMIEALADGNFRSAKVFYEGAARRNIFQSVRFIELDSMSSSPVASADEDIIYYFESSASSGVYYYVTAKGGKQVFAYDRGQPGILGKIQAFNDALQLQAIRE
jgi:hypothetical protein